MNTRKGGGNGQRRRQCGSGYTLPCRNISISLVRGPAWRARAIADAARTDLDRNENLDKIEERIRDAE
ncbi:hypothetical protein [Rhodococcus erythropolis]|uniref:hypothetical protein n=1 Tax=Rhodococcus erythropolis TaxID=1833 RepID=UPI0024B791AF|nr:hypothetical protein [Rhodococcus erythropolis]MDJ0015071.1 hypothetical protein [Rhodococcus erythropolis]